MAGDTQPLKEFVDNLLSDVSSGSISVYEAISAASQYAYLRELISSERTMLGQAETAGESELVAAFEAIISRASEKLGELPNFQSQLPDQVLQEKDVRDLGEVRKHAAVRIKEAAQGKLDSQKSQRRTFIHNLVGKFSSTAPTASEEALGAAVDRALVAAAGEATQKQTKERFAEMLIASNEIASAGLSADQIAVLKKDIAVSLTENDAYVSEVVTQTKRTQALTAMLYEKPDMKRPDVFVDVVLNAPASESITDTLLRADKLAGVAASLESNPSPKGGNLQFFSASGARGVAKGLQQGADGILSLVGEPVREMIIHEKVNGTLRSMLSGTQRFVDRLGENFVHSSLFTRVAQDLTRQLSEKPSGGQVRTIFDDVFSSVFRGPLSPALAHGTQDRLLDFFELARANAAAPPGRSFLPSGIMPWDVFRTFNLQQSVYGKSGTSRPYAVGFPLLGIGWLSNAIGSTFGSLVDRTTSFFLTSPLISQQLRGSRRAAAIPVPIGEDMPLLTALIVVGALLLLFILPTPLNVSQLSHSAKVSAIFASLRRYKETILNITSGNIQATSFVCTWSGPSPVASISTCPVHAPITQGPFSPSGSHKNLNAYDFGASQGTPVVAAHDAYVASYANTYEPYQYAYGSYGNNVVLVATDPSNNQQYCTNYAHLLDVSPQVVASSGKPVLIPAGTVIGYVDTTGYTYGCIGNKCGEGYGTHLHWGYKGPNQTTPFPLPAGCP